MHELTKLTLLRDQLSAISSAIYHAFDKQRSSWDLLRDQLSAISGAIHQALDKQRFSLNHQGDPKGWRPNMRIRNLIGPLKMMLLCM